MSFWDPLRGMLNAASPAPLFIGLTALLVALLPRYAYMVMALFIALGYLVATLGPVLAWPAWIVALTPFHYLTLVPAQPWDWGASVVFVVIGLATGSLGLFAFARRDIPT